MPEPTAQRGPCQPIAVEKRVVSINWGFSLTPEQADELYNNLYRVFDLLGIGMAREREKHGFHALYALYDGLYAAGIVGDGSHS